MTMPESASASQPHATAQQYLMLVLVLALTRQWLCQDLIVAKFDPNRTTRWPAILGTVTL